MYIVAYNRSIVWYILFSLSLPLKVAYAVSLAVFSLIWFEDHHSPTLIFGGNKGEKLLAVFCMVSNYMDSTLVSLNLYILQITVVHMY